MPLSTHYFKNYPIEFRVQSNEEVIHSPCTLELGHSYIPKDLYRKKKTCE